MAPILSGRPTHAPRLLLRLAPAGARGERMRGATLPPVSAGAAAAWTLTRPAGSSRSEPGITHAPHPSGGFRRPSPRAPSYPGLPLPIASGRLQRGIRTVRLIRLIEASGMAQSGRDAIHRVRSSGCRLANSSPSDKSDNTDNSDGSASRHIRTVGTRYIASAPPAAGWPTAPPIDPIDPITLICPPPATSAR